MIESAPSPSLRLRLLTLVARWALRLTAAVWLVFLLVWGGLHLLIVPRIPQWGAQLERWASQAVGAPVRIGSITTHAGGLFPSLELRGVQVLDSAQQPALQLPRVVLTLSPQALLRGGLEQLYIDAPSLEVARQADGRWQVAGLELTDQQGGESSALTWLLEQPELVVRGGQLHFVDALRAQEMQLTQVGVVLRGGYFRHGLRLDARDAQGQALHVSGLFRRSVLPELPGRGEDGARGQEQVWRRWSGQWFAQLQLQQLPVIDWPAAWGIAQAQGQGQVRVWADVVRGRVVGSTVDVHLPQASVYWSRAQGPDQPDLPPLQLRQVQGRLSAQWQAQAWAVQAEQLGFDWQLPPEGELRHWAPSSWSVESASAARDGQQHLRLQLQQADLGLAGALLQSLPVPHALRQQAARWQPAGLLQQLQLRWSAGSDQPSYQASGQLRQLQLQGQAAEQGVGTPGVQGLDVDFDLSEHGGSAQLRMRQGVLQFPGVFEEPDIPLQRLQARLQWTQRQGDWQLSVSDAEFANADAQGRLQARWRTGPDADSFLPGILQLRGVLTRADGTRVHRYLPLHIPAVARHYVRDSVLAGHSRQVEFEVTGDLRHMPFDTPGSGRFYIRAPIEDAVYDYVPASIRPRTQAPWPRLEQLSGTLVFEGAGVQVQDASTRFASVRGGPPQVPWHDIQAEIADLNEPTVRVAGRSRAQLNALLDVLRGSAVEQLTQGALAEASAHGPAEVQLQLQLPIDALQHSRVQGLLTLQGNRLRLSGHSPELSQLHGSIRFHEQGFALEGVHGQSLGGPVQVSGGMPSIAEGVHVQAQGQASAQGLVHGAPLDVVRQLAAHASGGSAYTVQVNSRGGAPQVLVRSDLQGLTLQLPAPLDKPTADSTLPLLVRYTPQPEQRAQLHVLLEGRGQLRYLLNQASDRVESGFIALGEAEMPARSTSGEVVAQVRLPLLDIDAWRAALGSQPPGAAGDSATPASTGAGGASFQDFLPRRLVLDVQDLRVNQRHLGPSSAQLSQKDGLWRGQLQATQFAGYVEYRPADERHPSGLVFARLNHLYLPRSVADAEAQVTRPAASMPAEPEEGQWPALDIHVQDFQLADKALGQLSLLARQRRDEHGRYWALERFQLLTPQTRWRAKGRWFAPGPQQPRNTQLEFTLETSDAGAMLARLGMPGVVEGGQGSLSGQVLWRGSPLAPHWPSMEGQIHMDMGKGQFLKVEPGMGKLLSVLSLQSIGRRLSLDFRDIFSAGFAFDFVRGDVAVRQGIARTNNLQMKGLNAAVLMEGEANLQDETQQLRLVVVPEINAMTASLVASAINPVVGLGSFLAQAVLRGPLIAAATRSFTVTGSWTDPVVTPSKDTSLPQTAPQEVPPIP